MAETHPKGPPGTEGQELAPQSDPGHATSDPFLKHEGGEDRHTSQRNGEGFWSISNLEEAPRRVNKWTGDNYIFEFQTIQGNIV